MTMDGEGECEVMMVVGYKCNEKLFHTLGTSFSKRTLDVEERTCFYVVVLSQV